MYRRLLSLRYFRSRFMTLASLLAIMFGVAMLVIVLSIMGGYLVKLKEQIRGQEAHIHVTSGTEYDVTRVEVVEKLLSVVPEVRGFAPFVERLAVYESPKSFRPCQLKAIDPVAQMRVGNLASIVLRSGESDSLLDLLNEPALTGGEESKRISRAMSRVHEVVAAPDRAPLSEEELQAIFAWEWRVELLKRNDPSFDADDPDADVPPGVLVGAQLLIEKEMAIGDRLTIVTMNPDPENQVPMQFEFIVAGAFKSGDFDVDSGAVYAELSVVQNWLELFNPTTGDYLHQGIRIALDETADLNGTAAKLREILTAPFPLYEVRTWEDLRRNLLRAVLIEKFLVYFLVLILVVFTGSMILLMLLLTVIEKTRDVGVLLALGATPKGVSSIFLQNGLIICVAGTSLGLGAGLLFCEHINTIHDAIHQLTGIRLFNPEIYHMDRIPIAFEPWDLFLGTVPPVLIGFVASSIPAIWAPRRDPIKAIQHE